MTEKVRKLNNCLTSTVSLLKWGGMKGLPETYISYNEDSAMGEYLADSEDNRDRVFPLEASVLDQFERAFAQDFSDVKIHTGPNADQITAGLHADAVTMGQDIYFNSNQYAPDSREGVKLLAHELQHAVQNKENRDMIFVEDIEGLEQEAVELEALVNQLELHNITEPLLDRSGNPGTGRAERAANMNEARGNKQGFVSPENESMESFTKKRRANLIEIVFPSGKKLRFTPEQYDKVVAMATEKIIAYIKEQEYLLTEEEYSKFMLRFMESMGKL